MRQKRLATLFAVCMVLGMMFVPSVMAWPPEVWEAGDEVEITGHSFDEEYWTADISNTTEDDAEIIVTMSYVNNNDAQAFLLAFKTYEKNGNVSTLPYQLFGMHYTGPGGHDVFIGAVLAFLMAFNDTCNGTVAGHNGMPDPHHAPGECQESVYYVLPFGVGEALDNDSYAPEVSAISAERLGDGHYRFGMTYENMYAKVIDASNILSLIASTILPIYIAKFSELTVVYEITYNDDNSVTAETYYKLGQVTQLWLWGQETEPTDILVDNWGIAAVHYVATFWSTYKVTGDVDKHVISTGIQKPLDQGLDLAVGSPPRKVFNLGIRGTFDLIDEDSGTTIRDDADAYNMLVNARYEDKWLVAWQGGFSLGFMATMAYALSSDLQSKYDSPLDLLQKGGNSFIASDLWYAVSFPQWNGYRVVHDPVYTAFIGTAEAAGFPIGLMLIAGILLLIVIVAVVVAVAVRKSKGP